MNLVGILVGIFLAILPLVFWQWAKIPYEVPKVWFVQRCIEFFALVGLFTPQKLSGNKLDIKLLIILAIWLGIAITASVLGEDMAKSVWGNQYRVDGLVTLFHLAGFSLILALFWQKSWKEWISRSIVIGSTAVSIWAIVDAIKLFVLKQPTVFNWDGALGGPFGQPVFLAGFLLVVVPFSFYLLLTSKKHKNVILILILIQIAGLILTRSLAPVLGLILLLLLHFGLLKNKLRIWLPIIVVGVFVTVLVVGYWWKTLQAPQFIVAEGRERIFIKLILAIQKKPLLGYGVANVDYAFDSVVWPIKFNNDVYVDKAHSHILESLVTTGVIGLIAYMLLLFAIGIKLVKSYLKNKNAWNICLLTTFLMFVFHSQTNIISISEELIFWLLIGISLREQGFEERE